MKVSTSILLSLGLLTVPSSAAPTHAIPKHSPPAARACAIEYPSYIGFIEKQDPSHRATNGTYFLAWKEPSVVSSRPIPNGLDIDTLLQFNTPSGSWGCQLELIFPQGYWALLGLGGGTNKLNVYRVTDLVPASVSWNTAPQPSDLFGTTPALETDQAVKQDTKIVINSSGCERTMSFRVKIAEEAKLGGVEFWKDASFPGAGWRLTHNC